MHGNFKGGKEMFSSLQAEIKRKGMSAKDLSNLTQIKYDTLLSKLNGRTEFTRAEMCKIKAAVAPHMSLDDLFDAG